MDERKIRGAFGATALLVLGALGAMALATTPAPAQVSLGKATTAAPVYATGTNQPLSLDTGGNLRVVGGGGSIVPKPETGPVTTTAVTVGVASAQALAAGSRDYLALINASPSAFVACNFGAAAVVNGAGSITLSPYQSFTWESSFAPDDAINCIASAAATPFTIFSSAQ